MKKERKHTQRPGQNTNTGKEKTHFMTSNSGVKKDWTHYKNTFVHFQNHSSAFTYLLYLTLNILSVFHPLVWHFGGFLSQMIGKGKILMERTVVGWGQCIGLITPAKDLVEVFVRNQQWSDTIYLYVSKIQVSMYFFKQLEQSM